MTKRSAPPKKIDLLVPEKETVRQLMASGEHETLEFKSSLCWDHRKKHRNKDLEHAVVKTLAGFLNWQGGILLIGVNDTGTAVGIALDYETLGKSNRDGFELHLGNLVAHNFGEAASSYLTATFHEIDGEDICQVTVEPSSYPIYTKDSKGKDKALYLRTGNATRSLPVDEVVKYVQHHWRKPEPYPEPYEDPILNFLFG